MASMIVFRATVSIKQVFRATVSIKQVVRATVSMKQVFRATVSIKQVFRATGPHEQGSVGQNTRHRRRSMSKLE